MAMLILRARLCACILLQAWLSHTVPVWYDQGYKGDVPDAPRECSEPVLNSIAWGTATSAFQIEGGSKAGGRSPSIWDEFAAQPGNIADGSNASVACDHYHRFRQDVQMMKSMGIKNYRFSVSWSRVLPGARRGSAVSTAGAHFYGALIDELLRADITPLVTMFHFDLPQVLQDAYGGLLSPQVADDFAYYADTLFRLYGERVLTWITVNEPRTFCLLGYRVALWPPKGASQADTLRCGHHMLLMHARAVAVYRAKYRRSQRGRVGIALDSVWAEPASSDEQDELASKYLMDDEIGWFAGPLFHGAYPPSFSRYGSDVPQFTEEETEALHGSADFLGFNHYTTKFVTADSSAREGYFTSFTREGEDIGAASRADWLYIVPWGFRTALRYLKHTYGDPEIIVTENGVTVWDEGEEYYRFNPLHTWTTRTNDDYRHFSRRDVCLAVSTDHAFSDDVRVEYFRQYIGNLCLAVAQDKVRVSAYFAWSLMDNFEWHHGYSQRFGMTFIDFRRQDLTRRIKKSALFLSRRFFNASRARLTARSAVADDFVRAALRGGAGGSKEF